MDLQTTREQIIETINKQGISDLILKLFPEQSALVLTQAIKQHQNTKQPMELDIEELEKETKITTYSISGCLFYLEKKKVIRLLPITSLKFRFFWINYITLAEMILKYN